MDETGRNRIQNSYQSLFLCLEEIAKVYSALFDLLVRESEFLIQANLESLNESNKTKDAMLLKLKSLDQLRERLALDLGLALGLNSQAPRLLELAARLTGETAKNLEAMHAKLEQLIGRVTELNRDNERYANSALQTLNGALGEIKETLAPKKTYDRKGKMAHGPEKSGHLAHKEA